jgi:hypothetical protein
MFRVAAWLGLFAWLTVSTSSAQVAPDSAEYTAAVREALAEFDDGNFAEARALFRRAHELQPSARTLRGLGISAFDLREYEDATRKLEEALASRVKPLDGALRSETQQLLERAYRFLGRYELSMQPTFARLLVDGVESDVRAGQRLLLSIGRHQLEARAPAYESDKRMLDVAGGEHTGLSFTLTKLPVAPVVLASVTPSQRGTAPATLLLDAPRSDRRLYKNPWLWTATGLVVVAIVVTAVALAGRDTRTRERAPYITGPNVAVVDGLVLAP